MWFLDQKEREKLCQLKYEEKALLAGWLMGMVPTDRRMCCYFLLGNSKSSKVVLVECLGQALDLIRHPG